MQNRRNNLNKNQRNLPIAGGRVLVLCLTLLCTAMIFFVSPHRGWAQEQDNDASPTTVDWKAVDHEKILETINEWRAAAKRDPLNWSATELQNQIDLHPNRLAGFLSDALVDSFSSLKPVFQILQTPPQSTGTWKSLIDPSTFSQDDLPESARQHLRLACGSWLARHQRYDDALEMLNELSVESVLDPASLLFYSGLSHHHILQHKAASVALNQLMQQADEVPERYATLAKLMLTDIRTTKPNSLREIARLMQDAGRRQSLHRSGTRVLDQERQVISKLDQMIAELEKKLDQQQQQQQQGSGNTPSSSPMEQSTPGGMKGDGEVTEVPLTDGGAWGNLPPKQRAAVLAEITRDMPPHYREVIEEYFRQLARESSRKSEPGKSRRP